MKPMLTLDLMLGGGAGHAEPGAGRSPTDDLEHRLVQVVWANGEGLDTVTPTRGTALLQHGFKEWAAARGVTVVDAAGVWPAVQQCDAENWMPLVFCRDLDAPLHVLRQLQGAGSCALMALGAPSSLRLRPGRAGLQAAWFPLPLPAGIVPGQCLWLGAPDMLAHQALSVPTGLRVASSDLPGAMAPHLHAAETRLRALAPAHLWCVLFLDDLVLGDSAATAPAGLQAEALAATLRWLQRQVPSVFVFVLSHERVTPPQRCAVAHMARHVGGALYRHAGVRREAYPAPQSTQKKR